MNNILKKSSTILGTGLVALDVILNGSPTTPAKLCAGGSCGNVLSILSYLGWDSKPIARLSNSNATISLFNDFRKFQIDTSLITTTDDGKTPIIIHRILKDVNGNATHKFEFKIPGSNQWLPMYKPVLANDVENIIKKQPKTNVFYFDRVSRSTIELARHYSKNGALIFFEPSKLKNDKQTLECLKLAHVVKFSQDRITNYYEICPEPTALLEIETLGKEGLQYRLKSSKDYLKWNKIDSYKFNNIVDSAGAGDWCTAGIIHSIGICGLKSFKSLSEQQIIEALKIGQALGGINCNFDGARGIMYNVNVNSLLKNVEAVINNKSQVKMVINTDINILTVKNLLFETLI